VELDDIWESRLLTSFKFCVGKELIFTMSKCARLEVNHDS